MTNLILIFTILFSLQAQAQLKCSDIFKPAELLTKQSSLDDRYLSGIGFSYGKRSNYISSEKEYKQRLFSKLHDYNYSVRDRAFKKALKKNKLYGDYENLTLTEIELISNSYLFVDLPHALDDLLKVTKGKGSYVDFAFTYGDDALKNFLSTRKYLKSKSPAYNVNTLKNIHKRLMKGGIDDIDNTELGVFREQTVYFQMYAEDAIPPEQLKKLLSGNPYLTFSNQKSTSKGLVYGEMLYPSVENLTDGVIQKVKNVNSGLAKELVDYRTIEDKIATVKSKLRQNQTKAEKEKLQKSLDKLKERHDELVDNTYVLNKKMITSLVDENMEWFTRARSQLGELDSYEKIRAFSDLAAEAHRNMISIHPFVDGNGRTMREFSIYFAFEKDGITAPRVLFPDGDIMLPLEKYQDMIWSGVVANVRFKDDMLYRLRHGLSFNNSGHIFLPPPSRPLSVSLKKSSSTVRKSSGKYTYLPSDYYREFVAHALSKDKSLLKRLKNDFYNVSEELKLKAKGLFSQDHIMYNHTKRGMEKVALEPVTDTFVEFYKRTSYSDPTFYKEKVRRFYDKDQVIWRGLADTENIPTQSEILDNFRVFNFHMASNEVLGTANNNQKSIIRAAEKDFKRYNDDLFANDDSLITMAKDHSETGSLYGRSYGYSTSKDRKVGKAFAMGAMVVADYGKHMDFQHLLQSRVLVGQMKSVKDVDLTTLRQVRKKFSYKYGRQQEVMGIGVADPDAIMIVQTLDEKGKAIKTYLRDSDKPNLIRVIEGEVTVGKAVDESKVLKIIDLNKV